jgi:hypothetical protein
MRSAAAAIDELLLSVDDKVNEQSGTVEFAPGEVLTTEESEEYQRYEEIWAAIEDGLLEKAALLFEAFDESARGDVIRTRSIILRLCERSLIGLKGQVHEIVDAVKAKAILENLDASKVFKNVTSATIPQDGESLANLIIKADRCSVILGLSEKECIDPILNNAKLEGCTTLQVALNLQKEDTTTYASQLAPQIFERWLASLSTSQSITELFGLCKTITEATMMPLPPAWLERVKGRLTVTVPRDCSLLMAPLVGLPTGQSIPPAPAEMERLFVPMGLFRVLKLT